MSIEQLADSQTGTAPSADPADGGQQPSGTDTGGAPEGASDDLSADQRARRAERSAFIQEAMAAMREAEQPDAAQPPAAAHQPSSNGTPPPTAEAIPQPPPSETTLTVEALEALLAKQAESRNPAQDQAVSQGLRLLNLFQHDPATLVEAVAQAHPDKFADTAEPDPFEGVDMYELEQNPALKALVVQNQRIVAELGQMKEAEAQRQRQAQQERALRDKWDRDVAALKASYPDADQALIEEAAAKLRIPNPEVAYKVAMFDKMREAAPQPTAEQMAEAQRAATIVHDGTQAPVPAAPVDIRSLPDKKSMIAHAFERAAAEHGMELAPRG